MKKWKKLLKHLKKKSDKEKELFRKKVFPSIGTIEYYFDDFKLRCETNMAGDNIYWYIIPLNFMDKKQIKLENIMRDVHPEDVSEERLNLLLLQISDI